MTNGQSNLSRWLKQIKKKFSGQGHDNASGQQNVPISTNLLKNEKMIKEILGDGMDVMLTKFSIRVSANETVDAMLVAIDGLVDEQAKRDSILTPLQHPGIEQWPNKDLDSIQNMLAVKNMRTETDLMKALYQVLSAQALLLVQNSGQGLLIDIPDFEIRSIEEPETEQTVRGPREGFIESISVNMSMLRRKISHPDLRFESMKIGEYTQTNVVITYIQGVCDPKIINRVKKRLKKIDVDQISSSGDIEQLIEDHPYSIFPTIGNTERPDKAAGMLLEGRVVIIVSGSPVTLIVPNLFVENFMIVEDYNSRPYYSSAVRLLRFISFLISITVPALYISALNFNKALIPSDLIIPLVQARETVPFPLAMEVFIGIFMFEIVREAGVRLPRQIGTAISIVGPLILGDVAVSAGLIGAPTIVIVSFSYIAAFVVTPIADVTAFLRILLFISASLFGSFGLSLALLAILTHMVSLSSMGVPYMAPFAPIYFKDWKDTFVRVPIRLMRHRPKSIPNKRSKRIQSIPDTREKQ